MQPRIIINYLSSRRERAVLAADPLRFLLVFIVLSTLVSAIIVSGGNTPVGRHFVYKFVVEKGTGLQRAADSKYLEENIWRSQREKFYGEIGVADYHNVSSTYNSMMCYYSFSRGRLEVDVIDVSPRRYLVNITLLFDNFTLLCPPSSKPLEELFLPLARWNKTRREGVGDMYRTRRFALSRIVEVDPRDNNVVDPETGEELGEWLVWLSPGDMEANATVLLVGRIGDIAYTPPGARGVYGLANLVLLNSSWTAPKGYVVAGAHVDKARTVVARVVTATAAVQRYVNLSDPALVGMARRLASSSRCLSFVDYGNGSYGIVERCLGPVYRSVAGHKPWRLGLEPTGLLCRDTGCIEASLYYVDYGGKWFLHPPFDPYVLVYDRATGVLLEQGLSGDTYFFGHRIGDFQGYAVSLVSDYFLVKGRLHLRLVYGNGEPVGLLLADTDAYLGSRVIRGRGGVAGAYLAFILGAGLLAAVALWVWRRGYP